MSHPRYVPEPPLSYHPIRKLVETHHYGSLTVSVYQREVLDKMGWRWRCYIAVSETPLGRIRSEPYGLAAMTPICDM